jgi:hypothetical protein
LRATLAPFLFLLALTACGDPLAERRIDQLERELRALRAGAAGDALQGEGAAAALAPLKEAIELLVRRADVERTRWNAATAELGQLADLVHGFVDESRRAEVEGLRQRLQELEQQARSQAAARAEESALVLRALQTTAEKLEAFLRQVAPAKAPATGGGERRSDLHPAWFAALGVVAGATAMVLLRRPARRRPAVVELPEAFVDPPPVAPPAAAADGHHPLLLRAVVPTDTPGDTARSLSRWLAEEPRVLSAPAPRCEVRTDSVHVSMHVSSALPAAERAGLVAEIQLGAGALESGAGRRTA